MHLAAQRDWGRKLIHLRCIMVRSSVLITSLIDAIEKEKPAIEEIHSWKVDRHNEPCHEQVPPMKSSDEI
jgi:hypothetical protein